MKITEKQKEILSKYDINVDDYNDLEELLFEIDDEMTSHIDENDEPLPEFLELEEIYDEIFDTNK